MKTQRYLKCLLVLVLLGRSAMAIVPSLHERAQQGDAAAQCNLGLNYANGRGVPRDSAVGAGWLRKSAEQGFAKAQFNLGVMFITGNGVAKDSAEGVQWVRKAADQGYAYAQGALGEQYAKGDGVAKDPVAAEEWYSKAAEQGLAGAQYALGGVYAQKAYGLPILNITAVGWYRKAAEQGHVGAQFALGQHYAKGQGVKRDLVEAHAWTGAAASLGYGLAKAALPDIAAEMTASQISQAEDLARVRSEKFRKKN